MFMTRLSLQSDAAKILGSSIYSSSVALKLMGLDNLYPSIALIFRAIGFKHIVNFLGHSRVPSTEYEARTLSGGFQRSLQRHLHDRVSLINILKDNEFP